MSSLVIHNIKGKSARGAAVDEAMRVLRPGGRLAIVDIGVISEYQRRLAELDAREIRAQLGWRMWWGGPWMSTHLVSAVKLTG